MRFPKCETRDDCGVVEYVVKSTPDSVFDEDTFVCKRCALNLYIDEETIKIPDFETILDCLNFSEYSLTQIDTFKEAHNLDKFWKKLLPNLEEFTINNIQLKDDLETAKAENNWQKIPYIHIQAKELLSSILNSELFIEYTRQSIYMKFCDQEAKKKPKESFKAPSEESKINIDKSEHDKVLEKLQEARKLCQQKDEQLCNREAELVKRSEDIKEKEKLISMKDDEMKQLHELAQKEMTEIKHEDSKSQAQILKSSQPQNKDETSAAHNENLTKIKELTDKIKQLEMRDKIQQDLIEQLSISPAGSIAPADSNSGSNLNNESSFPVPKQVANRKDSQTSDELDVSKIIQKLKDIKKSQGKFGIDDFFKLKDMDMCKPDGEKAIYVNFEAASWQFGERKIEEIQNRTGLLTVERKYARGNTLPSMEDPSLSILSQPKSCTDTSSTIEALDFSLICFKRRISQILETLNPSNINQNIIECVKALEECSDNDARKTLFQTIFSKAIYNKSNTSTYAYMLKYLKQVLCNKPIKKNAKKKKQEEEKKIEPEIIVIKNPITKQIFAEDLQNVYGTYLHRVTKPLTNKQKRNPIYIAKYKEELFAYLELMSELYHNDMTGPMRQMIILKKLLHYEKSRQKCVATDLDLQSACYLLCKVGTKLDSKHQMLKDGKTVKPGSSAMKFQETFEDLLAILLNYKNDKAFTNIGKLIEQTLELRKTGWVVNDTRELREPLASILNNNSQRDHTEQDNLEVEEEIEAENSLSISINDDDESVKQKLIGHFIEFSQINYCDLDIFLSLRDRYCGREILEFLLDKLYYQKVDYQQFTHYFYRLHKGYIFNKKEIIEALTSFWKKIPDIGTKIPNIGMLFSNLLYFIIIDKKLITFDQMQIEIELDEDGVPLKLVNFYFKTLAAFLKIIQLNLNDKRLAYYYEEFKIEEICKELKPYVVEKDMVNELELDKIPKLIIDMLNVPLD
ncbi:unnamed protein product [Moneuplotes crassus]|uniref:Uncharacterized protein n=1 Tax=Euplotes crassus TaxID=5936 RepID=A0AAD1Y492_EUPCR|nr:unnamed protein product [Moneuplotes crassus]